MCSSIIYHIQIYKHFQRDTSLQPVHPQLTEVICSHNANPIANQHLSYLRQRCFYQETEKNISELPDPGIESETSCSLRRYWNAIFVAGITYYTKRPNKINT